MIGLGVLVSVGHSQNIGLPPKRFYSLDDLGGISSGFRLGFDSIGRVSIVYHNQYLVLNDDRWINRLEEGDSNYHELSQVVCSGEGEAYYTSHGSWGELISTPEGRLSLKRLSPESRPGWTLATEMDHILIVDDGVFFYNWNGLVYWDGKTGEHRFHEVRGLEHVFVYEGEIYVSIVSTGVKKLDLISAKLQPAESFSSFRGGITQSVVVQGDVRLICSADKGLLRLDDSGLQEWHTAMAPFDGTDILDICHLGEGVIALALKGKGIHVLNAVGEVLLSLTSGEYHGVKEIVSNEPGLFWYSTESGVGKVHFGSGVTVIDQRIGVSVDWPEVCRWDGRVLIGTSGRIYESYIQPDSGQVLFRLFEGQPDLLNVTVGAWLDYLFVGNGEGLLGLRPGEELKPILRNFDVARVIPVDDDLCYVIGTQEITALRLENGLWVESVSRVPGIGFPSVVHLIDRSVWIELGLNRVGRVSCDGETVRTEVYDDFPWNDPAWVNIGSIGSVAVLSGRGGHRVYFDESEGGFCESSELDRLLALCPFDVWRMVRDSDGIIWLSHSFGVSELRKGDHGYEFHFGLARLIREPSPILMLRGAGDLWVIGRHSLHHRQSGSRLMEPPQARPILVQARDSRSGKQVHAVGGSDDLGSIPYVSNTLEFLFFAGTHALDRVAYQVDVEGPFFSWSMSRASSLVSLPNLKEGRYRMNVSLMDAETRVVDPMILHFRVLPPWYRSSFALGVYMMIILSVAYVLFSMPVRMARSRNLVLARLVKERTHDLEMAMDRLREEERIRAVQQERNRIANEIHDSVQQGLSGLRLVIESTIKMQTISDDIRSRLLRAKTILEFTYLEMKHAVWGMETPLLVENDLNQALNRVAALMTTGSTVVRVVDCTDSFMIPPEMNHDLLRIAQESITNAIQHGGAQNVVVELCFSEGVIRLEIRDDGSGFDVDETMMGPQQHGLRGLLVRVGSMGGRMSVFSKIGDGSRILVKIPIQEGGKYGCEE